jgi:hypothetical protein
MSCVSNLHRGVSKTHRRKEKTLCAPSWFENVNRKRIISGLGVEQLIRAQLVERASEMQGEQGSVWPLFVPTAFVLSLGN